MRTKLRSHFASNIVGYLALSVALSGTAWAAAQIGPHDIKANAVRSKHIKDRQIKIADLARPLRPGIAGWELVTNPGVMLTGEVSKTFDTECPEGKVLLGGGVATFNDDIQIMSSTPIDPGLPGGGDGYWHVQVETFDGQGIGVDSSVNIRITCANVQETTP